MTGAERREQLLEVALELADPVWELHDIREHGLYWRFNSQVFIALIALAARQAPAMPQSGSIKPLMRRHIRLLP